MTVLRLRPPSAMTPHSLIVCLHGVGADAASLHPFGEMIQSANPTSAVVIPDAPHRFDLGGPGCQWFSVHGVTNANRAERIAATLPWLDAFIQAECRRWSLTSHDVGVCGFSQGAMMALALAGRNHPLRAIASIAGRVAAPAIMKSDSSPEIFLSHGESDPVVPFACLSEAYRAFELGGWAVTQLPVSGLGHTIAPTQAEAIGKFLARCFAAKSLEPAA